MTASALVLTFKASLTPPLSLNSQRDVICQREVTSLGLSVTKAWDDPSPTVMIVPGGDASVTVVAVADLFRNINISVCAREGVWYIPHTGTMHGNASFVHASIIEDD